MGFGKAQMLACLNYWADRHRPFWAVFYTRGRVCFISFFFHFFSISKFSNYVLIYRKKGRLLFLYTRRKYRSSSAHHKMVMHPFYRGRKIKDWSKMFDRKQYRVSNLDLQLKNQNQPILLQNKSFITIIVNY